MSSSKPFVAASALLAALALTGPMTSAAQSIRGAPAPLEATGRLQDRIDTLESELRRVTAENESLRRERDQAVAKAAQLDRIVDDMQRRPLFEGQQGAAAEQGYSPAPSYPQERAAPSYGAPLEEPASAQSRGPAPTQDYASAGSYAGAPISAPSEAPVSTGGSAAPIQGPAPPPPPVAGVARDVYDNAFSLLRARDYAGARKAFADFTAQYPEHPQAPLAIYWQGRAAAAQADHTDAAAQFVELLRRYPNTPQAADGAARLGQSLMQLQQVDQACAAFRQAEAHPNATAQVRQLARQEAVGARC